MVSKRPSIFISSTIYDFRDLRSSLKHYLSSLGFDVYLSEFNDFPKLADLGTFEAALETISHSDYYILLVGSRVGGFYDQKRRISITQREYREAYQLAQTGGIRILILVRDEIWKIRSDRKKLEEYLVNVLSKQFELGPEQIGAIVNHPSDLVNDAQFIFEFLREISREDEMEIAAREGGGFPRANWVHRFSSFEDIVDVLRVELRISNRLAQVALVTNLRQEILDNLIILTEKHKGEISPGFKWATYARGSLQHDINASSTMPGRYLKWLLVYALGATKNTWLSSTFIDQAVRSGEFLQFDKSTGGFASSRLSQRLRELGKEINRLRKNALDARQLLTEFMTKYKEIAKTESSVSVPNTDLLIPISFANNEENTINLSVAILLALDGDYRNLEMIDLNPPSPLLDQAEGIAKETPTTMEISGWAMAQSEEQRATYLKTREIIDRLISSSDGDKKSAGEDSERMD